MQSVLQSLHTVPGVIGGMLADDEGGVLAHTFPSLFDLAALQGVSSSINYNVVGLQDATGGAKFLDMRYDHGRIIVKPLQHQHLVLLCEQNLNLQLLFISINVAMKKLEKVLQTTPKPTPMMAVAASKPSQAAAPAQPAKPKTVEKVKIDPNMNIWDSV